MRVITIPDENTAIQAIGMVRVAISIQNLIINHVGVCSAEPYRGYLLVELDSSVPLPSLKIDPILLVRVCFIVKTPGSHSDNDYRALQSVQSL